MHSRRRERNTQFSLKFCRNRIFATNEWICIKNRQREFAAKKSGFSRNHRFYRILRCHRESNTEACHPALKTMTAKLYRKLRNPRFIESFAVIGKATQRLAIRRSRRWQRSFIENCRNSAGTEFSQQTNGFALRIDKGVSPRNKSGFCFIDARVNALPPPRKKNTIFVEILPKPNFRNKRMDLH